MTPNHLHFFRMLNTIFHPSARLLFSTYCRFSFKNFKPCKFGFSAVVYLSLLVNSNFAFALNARQFVSRPATVQPPLAVLYDSLVPRLLGGGLVMYFVPFNTVGEDQTDQPNWWKECPYTKMISPQGVREAKAVGRALSSLSAPIGLVQSSEVCTALTTATFLLGNPSIRIFHTPDLNPVDLQRQAGLKEQVIQVKIESHLQAGIWKGTNSVLSGFKLTPETAPHPVLAELGSGDSAVFEVKPSGEIILLARLNWRQWEEMTNYMISKVKKSKSQRGSLAKR